ncbi:MAG TPA: GxxExxY protein [Bacillota bacterium]|nr:GxxExxY protein [Bacillota bacterium]
MIENEITEIIIGSCIKIHKITGPGLLESAYEEMLCYELSKQGLSFQRQEIIPIIYDTIKIDSGFRADLIIQQKVIVELKSVEKLLPIHSMQLLTYLKLTDIELGLLINFNVGLLKEGIKRIVNKF